MDGVRPLVYDANDHPVISDRERQYQQAELLVNAVNEWARGDWRSVLQADAALLPALRLADEEIREALIKQCGLILGAQRWVRRRMQNLEN